jgi:type IV pilus assembly protein PilA
MKAVQKGFTLIELMIVVAIIGILAAIAIPAYQDYTIRSQVTEGLNLAASLKTGVSEYFAQNGQWPTCVLAAASGGCATGLGETADPSGKYVSDITINTAGTLVITYSNAGGFQANAKINTLTLALQPSLSGATVAGNEDVVWTCGSHAPPAAVVHQPGAGVAAPASAGLTTVPGKYLPAECRA